MIKTLFICSKNKLRSPTAEQVFSTLENVQTDSAGLANDADVVLSKEQIEWADIIFVMERKHRSILSQKFRPFLNNKRIICLNIPDNYKFMQTELIEILENKVSTYLINKGT
jgi:predicted protein tyrosine phosphatase